MNVDIEDRARGMLVGLAVGDALGAPVEFGFSSAQIEALGDKIETYYEEDRFPTFWNKHGYPHGAWTDDTSMALCLADSFLEKKGYDSYDIMDKFEKWLFDGYRSSSHRSIGAGQQTVQSLFDYKYNWAVDGVPEQSERAGNGTIMRLAPVIIANTFPERLQDGKIKKSDLEKVIEVADLSCLETHNSVVAVAITEIFATALYSATCGLSKDKIMDSVTKKAKTVESRAEGISALVDRALGDGEDLKDLWGYAGHTLAIALWGLLSADNFKDGMLAVIRLGGDTDTSGACYGQLAGAYYGYDAIPKNWRGEVYCAEELVTIADGLLALDNFPIMQTRFKDNKYFKERA